MIKRNPKQKSKQALLNKIPADQTSQIYPPFDIEQVYSAVDHRQYREDTQSQKDYSYYCLEKDQVKDIAVINPYAVQMAEIKCNENVSHKNGTFGTQANKYMPQKIQMNGNCYMKVGENFGQQQVHLEEKKALCGACKTLQMIPKNSSKFICYHCRTTCSCQVAPKSTEHKKVQTELSLFKCGTCGVKVKYQKGISQYIKCTRCQTVNFVAK